MFKNATLYRIAPAWRPSWADMSGRLEAARFVECGATQARSIGWVEPRGAPHGPLVESVGGQWLLGLMVETRVLPGAVVKRRTDEAARKIERESGRKPGRREMKELKEAAMLELLPLAFTTRVSVRVWIDPAQRLLLVDAGSQTRADEAVSFLVKSLEGLPVALIQTETSAAAAMAEWLGRREAPAGFSVDRDCELKSADEGKAAVRYARHTLDIDELRDHIHAGKLPTRLALTWEGRVSFELTDTMQIRKLSFLDVVFEGGSAGDEDGFDADAAIATGELSRLIPDLLGALGGERAALTPAPAPLPLAA